MIKDLTTNEFKEKIFNYSDNNEWNFIGNKPTVIDYYASWCSPCKIIAPILEELSGEYGNIDFYKIDTEEQSELAMTFNIKSIPSILLIPISGQPQMIIGVQSKENLKQAFKVVLGVE